MIKSRNNAFTAWMDGAPSIFTTRVFQANSSGKSTGQAATEAVEAYRKANGACMGTMKNISKAADKVLADRWGGAHSKAKPSTT